jgi:hypothetical protein
VVIGGLKSFGFPPFSKAAVFWMAKKSCPENLQCFLHAVPQPVPHPASLLNGPMKVILKQAFMRILSYFRQSCPVTETIKEKELCESVSVENTFQVKLKVSWSRVVGTVSEQTQHQAIGDNAPEVLLPSVEIVLNQSLWT